MNIICGTILSVRILEQDSEYTLNMPLKSQRPRCSVLNYHIRKQRDKPK